MPIKTKILFVCLGNICRSPAAEGIMENLVRKNMLSERIGVDSAGTNGYHDGEKADSRMRHAASKRGYELTHRSRRIQTEDFWDHDIIMVMDESNYRDVMRLAPDPQSQQKVRRITEYCTQHSIDHVPDPYYEGADGFELVLDILEDACRGILARIKIA